MGLFQRRRGKKVEDESERPASVGQDEEVERVQEEQEELERKKKQQAEAARRDQEAREQELERLNQMVDNTLSEDSEEFLRGTEQPGGE